MIEVSGGETMEQEYEVQVHKAFLIVEGTPKPLTRAMAKQFPVIRPFSARFDAMVKAIREGVAPEDALPPAYIKVNAATIERDALSDWYILVDHPDGGLAWAHPICHESYVASKGWPYDELEDLPTVIL
jgi:hypothetical protein